MKAIEGKILPQAVDFEDAVIGSVMVNDDNFMDVVMLEPRHFYNPQNQLVWRAILTLFNKDGKFDTLLVKDELKRSGKLDAAGGFFYLSNLVKKQTGKNNLKKYAEIVMDKYLRREGAKISTELLSNFYDDTIDVYITIDKANQEINEVSSFASVEEDCGAEEAIKLFKQNVNTRSDEEGNITGVKSGFTYIDNVTSGFQKGDLIILAGRPGMGKSAFATDVARYCDEEVGFFTLEMSDFQVWGRIAARGLKVNSKVLTKGLYRESYLEKINAEIRKYPKIHIDGTPGLSITSFKSKARKMKRDYGVKLIIIDYLQLMTGHVGVKYNGNENAELNDISKGLKEMAKELDIPIIALSQLSREVEKRKPPRPKLSDLRGSGGIEQDADMVGFFYRPEYYNLLEKIAPQASKDECKGLGCLIIDKHRGGSLANIWMRFEAQYSSFSDFIYDMNTGEEITEEYKKEIDNKEGGTDLPF